MVSRYENDYGVLQSGFWRLEVDTLHPRMVSLRVDDTGLGKYGEEMLMEGLGGLSVSQTRQETFSSRTSQGHSVCASLEKEIALALNHVRVGNFAQVDLRFSLVGERGEILRVEVDRQLTRSVELVTDVPFGLHLKRLFSLWSRPDLRFGHDPDHGYVTNYVPLEERQKRRVIGYHGTGELPEFIVHAAPGFPDFALRLNTGFQHVEQSYNRFVLVGVSSRDFKTGPMVLPPGRERWVLEFRLIPQGTLAPVRFKSGDTLVNRFVREFFDGHVLSAVSADHEFFGNNPQRHCFAPCAMQFEIKGFMVTDHAHWSRPQGDMESRWQNQIRRTLAHGRINPERVIALFDSGVWQDRCGAIVHETGSAAQNGIFALGCCWHLLKTGNREFAREIVPDIEALLRPLVQLQSKNHDGLLISPLPGTPGSPASGYNDCLSVGHMDTYLNVVGYDAFQKLAGLLEFLGEAGRAEMYRQRAAQILCAVNRHLWSEGGGRYVGWIDVEGKTHDFWFADINFYAFSAGLVPAERGKSMLSSFLAHPNHHRMFAAGLNLDPITDGSLTSPMRFGECIHGTLYLGPMAEEMVFRARAGGGECAWQMLKDLVAQWDKDRLYQDPLFQDWQCCNPHYFEWWQFKTGKCAYSWLGDQGSRGAATEPYLSDGGAMLWALYAGILGLCPDFQGLTIIPHVPRALADTKVGIRLMGRTLLIHYEGYGDTLQGLAVNGTAVSGNRVAWQDMPDGCAIKVKVG